MRNETIAGLDIGTTKTCTVVATNTPAGIEVLGVGEAPSTGLRKGVITDLEETIRSIEAATERAERMSGVHISEVYVGVTGEHVHSRNSRGVVATSGEDREVVAGDVRRVVEASKIIDVSAERQIIHALPRHFTVDGQEGVADPVGMSGGRLEVDTHIVTGGSTFIQNVLKCVHRAGLEPAAIVFEPLASSASTLLPEEKHVGVVLLDIGGGTTDVAVYTGGGAVHTSTVPLGGNVLTNDISLGLRTTFAEAERVKRAYGSAANDEASADESFTVKSLDGRLTRELNRAQLRAIIVPRLVEIFRLARTQIAERVPRDVLLAEVVLTGGGAHLQGIETAAAQFFGVPARVGVPTTVGALNDAVKQPQFATAVGLVMFGPKADGITFNGRRHHAWSRLAGWLSDMWN
ncbi:MAG: cell division protein FtsA [Candidatus Eremiobacteraeota bacterium]|nr:cell division protein FtsA [Candidatus Eremiobacteraeota bacterium]MBV9646399.1 cell division protein FtsA [Candidatus Eremiobacteraeota bacterium]